MRWIPCTERLPEKSGRYLVTRGSNVCGSLWDKVDILNYSDLMGLKKEKIWWSGNVGKIDFEKCDHVIAWMPLPDPYKTDTDKENIGLINTLKKEFGDVKRSDCFGGEDETTEDDSTVPAHWIDQGHKIFKCSNCGNYLDFGGVNAGRGTANYCPNCGAKMWNILTRKHQKSKAMFFKKTSKSELTKREEEIRDYIVNEYGEALYAVEVNGTPETRAREDEASKILGKIIDILGYKEENMSDE